MAVRHHRRYEENHRRSNRRIQQRSQNFIVRRFLLKTNSFSALHHPNVIRYLGLHVSKVGDTYMVMEFAQKGSLKDFLKAEKKTLQMSDKYEL
jgi:serine/threonine protein kinase